MAVDADKDRPRNIIYFLTGPGVDADNPANSKFDINGTTGEIFVLKVNNFSITHDTLLFQSGFQDPNSVDTVSSSSINVKSVTGRRVYSRSTMLKVIVVS